MALKTWIDVVNSPDFPVTHEQATEVAVQYFDEVIKPQVPEYELNNARTQFFKDVNKTIPEWTPPSKQPSYKAPPEEAGLKMPMYDPIDVFIDIAMPGLSKTLKIGGYGAKGIPLVRETLKSLGMGSLVGGAMTAAEKTGIVPPWLAGLITPFVATVVRRGIVEAFRKGIDARNAKIIADKIKALEDVQKTQLLTDFATLLKQKTTKMTSNEISNWWDNEIAKVRKPALPSKIAVGEGFVMREEPPAGFIKGIPEEEMGRIGARRVLEGKKAFPEELPIKSIPPTKPTTKKPYAEPAYILQKQEPYKETVIGETQTKLDEILRKPAFERTAEDRVFLQSIEQGKQPPIDIPVNKVGRERMPIDTEPEFVPVKNELSTSAEQFIKSQEVPIRKVKPTEQELPLGAEKTALEGKIPTEELPETALERATREAEIRKVETEMTERQMGLPITEGKMTIEERVSLLERKGYKEAAEKLRKQYQPTNIITWIKSKGGIDYIKEFWSGELDYAMEMQKTLKDVVNMKGGGRTLDNLAQSAYAEGWIKEATPTALLEAIVGKKIKVDIAEARAEKELDRFFNNEKGFLNIGDATDSVKKMHYNMKYLGGDLWDKSMRIVRMPYWNRKIRPIVDSLETVRREASAWTFDTRRVMDDYFKLKNKSNVDKILMLGDETKKVFNDAELKDKGLNLDEIKAYRSIRKGLDDLMNKGTRQFMKKAGFSDEEISKFIAEHTLPAYIPRYRTGRYGVYVANPTTVAGRVGKKTLSFEAFDNPSDAFTFARNISKELPSEIVSYAKGIKEDPMKANIFTIDLQRGKVKKISGEGIELDQMKNIAFRDPSSFMDILHSLPIVKNVLKSRGVTDPEIEKMVELLGEEYLKYFARGKLARRKYIPGYSEDIEGSLRRYIRSFPFSMNKRFSLPSIEKQWRNLPSEELHYGRDLIDYFMGRVAYEGRINTGIRAGLHTFYLSLKPSFGILNTIQRGQTTLWKAVADAGTSGGNSFLKAQAKEIKLYKDAIRSKSILDAIEKATYLDSLDKTVLKRIFREGELESMRLMDVANIKEGTLKWLNFFGFISERSNRIHAAMTSLDIGKKAGFKGEDLYKYVVDFVDDTQFMYSKSNRPVIGRGKLAPLFVFKSYVLNYMNFLKSLYDVDKKAFLGAVSTAMALGGTGGILGADTVMDIVDWAMEKHDPKWRMTKKSLQEKIPLVVRQGVPSLVGLQGSITFGAPELFGIAGVPIVKELLNLPERLGREDISFLENIRRLSPTIVKHAIGTAVLLEGMPKDIFDKPKLTRDDINRLPQEIRRQAQAIFREMPDEIPDHEKVLYAIGFTTTTLSRYYDDIRTIKKAGETVKQKKAELSRAMGKARSERDYERFRELREKAQRKGLQIKPESIRRQTKEYREAE